MSQFLRVTMLIVNLLQNKHLISHFVNISNIKNLTNYEILLCSRNIAHCDDID